MFYRTQEVPYGNLEKSFKQRSSAKLTYVGINFFGKIVLDEEGNCVHARAFRPSENGEITFHAIHVRPSDQGGAVFTKGEPLEYFEYWGQSSYL